MSWQYSTRSYFCAESSEIDAAVHGRKECVFTWGGLAVSQKGGNPFSDGRLDGEKSAEVIVPKVRPYGGTGRTEQQ